MTETKPTMNITALAVYIGIPKRTLYDMIKNGSFSVEPIKGTKPRKWDKETVDAWRLNKG